MRDNEPQSAESMSAVSLILLFFGLAIVFVGLGLGLWLITIGYQALYHPEHVPLVGKVAWHRDRAEQGRPAGMGIQLKTPPHLYARYVTQLDEEEQGEERPDESGD